MGHGMGSSHVGAGIKIWMDGCRRQQKKLEEIEGLKELLYADDLALMVELEEKAVEKFSAWKRGIERRELRGNLEKMKVMISGEELMIRMESGGIVQVLWKRCEREFSVVYRM